MDELPIPRHSDTRIRGWATCCACRSAEGWCFVRRARGLGQKRSTAIPWTQTSGPTEPESVERAPLRSCMRRGAAIDLILDRGRENRSQLVFTSARGRDAVFWQSPRARKQARPGVTTPTARAAGIAELEILVDTREQYAYRFTAQQA